jgi:hypothetical protein
MIAYTSLVLIILSGVTIGGFLMFLSRPQSNDANNKNTLLSSAFSGGKMFFRFISKIFIFTVILILPFALLKVIGK